MVTFRFAVSGSEQSGSAAFSDLRTMIALDHGPELVPMWAPTQKLCFELMRSRGADVAWCGPMIAFDLEKAGIARPIAAVLRKGSEFSYATLVASGKSGISQLGQIPKARVGWVSPDSARGYVVLRQYLKKMGVACKNERFLGSHAAIVRALREGEIDVGGTHCTLENGRFRAHGYDEGVILATVGPIPGDYIMQHVDIVDESLATALERLHVPEDNPLFRTLDVTGFARTHPSHFASLAKWSTMPHGTGTWNSFCH